MTKKVAHCHRLVAETAKSAANELYDTLMSENRYYEAWKKKNPGASAAALRSRFVTRNWGKCIPVARATLAHMLSKPIDEVQKELIMEALVLDNTLLYGRANPHTILGGVSQ